MSNEAAQKPSIFRVGVPDLDHGLPVLDAAPGHLIRCAQQVHTDQWARHVGTAMTSVQYGVLLVVGQQPGLDQRTIGRRASLDSSTAGDVVARLVTRGFLLRDRAADDGRRKVIRLTDEGERALLSSAPKVVAVQELLLETLSFGEGEDLLAVLRLIAYQGDPPSPDSGEDNLTVSGWPLRLPALRLHTAPGHLIRRAQQVHTTLWGELVAGDLTSVQYGILLDLHHHPEIDQRTLGEHVSLDKSTGAEVIRRLVTRGLIRRKRDVADGRRNVLALTKPGRDRLFGHARAVNAVQEELMRWASPDQRDAFFRLMTRIVNADL